MEGGSKRDLTWFYPRPSTTQYLLNELHDIKFRGRTFNLEGNITFHNHFMKNMKNCERIKKNQQRND